MRNTLSPTCDKRLRQINREHHRRGLEQNHPLQTFVEKLISNLNNIIQDSNLPLGVINTEIDWNTAKLAAFHQCRTIAGVQLEGNINAELADRLCDAMAIVVGPAYCILQKDIGLAKHALNNVESDDEDESMEH